MSLKLKKKKSAYSHEEQAFIELNKNVGKHKKHINNAFKTLYT